MVQAIELLSVIGVYIDFLKRLLKKSRIFCLKLILTGSFAALAVFVVCSNVTSSATPVRPTWHGVTHVRFVPNT
jgi:hypothetical protein